MDTDKRGFKSKGIRPCAGFGFLINPRKSDFIRVQSFWVLIFYGRGKQRPYDYDHLPLFCETFPAFNPHRQTG